MKNKLAVMVLLTLTIVSCDATKHQVDPMEQEDTINTEINDNTWELTTLDGQNIDQSGVKGKKIQFTLNSTDKTISGFSGCNIFSGSYSLEAGGHIRISQVASTRMACPDSKFNENEYLKIFELTDNYTIQNGILSMNVGRRAALAVFKITTMENREGDHIIRNN
ncbi:META domain-containing protein [Ulvibacter antarcticus]|uniref:META domain-containing protein n=1 Tax=Ulvibacter antarcticus TaxID=442714 RepID=A0A3L9YKT3_9FLAO|nr:META domain-containing protein [Ulvibacter antarcticus]RMA58745.1 META domain-containing protein [Ulvibacter antarcticus]